MESCEKQWLLFIPDWGHALCSVPGKHCWQVWCFQIAPGFVEIFNIPKVDWRCHSKRDSWNVSSTNSTNHFRFQIYIFFLNLLSLWIIHFQFITFDSCFVFKDGSNFFSFSTQFPPARALVQRRLRTGTVCLQCLLRSHRGHRVDRLIRLVVRLLVFTWWPDFYMMIFKKSWGEPNLLWTGEAPHEIVWDGRGVWVGKLFLLMLSCFWCIMGRWFQVLIMVHAACFLEISGASLLWGGWTFCWPLVVI